MTMTGPRNPRTRRLPVTVFVLGQRYFVENVATGGLK